jgi:hypothetical protein
MINRELINAVLSAAVLAAHIVTVDDVEAGVNHPFPWDFVKIEKHDHPGQGEREILRSDELLLIDLDSFGFVEYLQGYGIPHVADVDGNHPCIQCENRCIKHVLILTDYSGL